MNRQRAMFAARAIALAILAGSCASGATWYVRPDGGTNQQCTGKSDAAYPGSGSAQACAVNHPFWLLNSPTSWRIAGGDTVIFDKDAHGSYGSYRMGYGAPNTGPGGIWGDNYAAGTASRTVGLPQIPGGTPGNPTRFVGAEWQSGCAHRPEIWGSGGTNHIFYLGGGGSWNAPGSAHTDFECLEVTDHDQCGFGMGTSTPTNRCENEPLPTSRQLWAKNAFEGLYIEDVTLRNLYIHGIGSAALFLAPVKNYTLQQSVITSNMANVGFDPGATDSHNFGTILVEDTKILWDGCIEYYPNDPNPNHHCIIVDSYGNAGDNIGPDHTGGTWIFRRDEIAYAASDGIDLLYVDQAGGSITLDGIWAHSNNGNQVKVSSGATTTVMNSVIVGDCRFLANSGNPLSVNVGACRGGGQTLVVALPGDTTANLFNNTITSGQYPSSPMLLSCKGVADGAFRNCNANTRFVLKNNIFYGVAAESIAPYQFAGAPQASTANVSGWDSNLWFGLRAPCPYAAGTQVNAICGKDPFFVNPAMGPAFDAHVLPGSPAIDAGVAIPSVVTDFDGNPRPQGKAYDVGAYEATLSVPVIKTNSAPPVTTTSSRVVSLSWVDTSNPAGTQYTVYRGAGACSSNPQFTAIGPALSVKTFEDSTASVGIYCYRVTAKSGDLESPLSNGVEIEVRPSAPSGLMVQ